MEKQQSELSQKEADEENFRRGQAGEYEDLGRYEGETPYRHYYERKQVILHKTMNNMQMYIFLRNSAASGHFFFTNFRI